MEIKLRIDFLVLHVEVLDSFCSAVHERKEVLSLQRAET